MSGTATPVAPAEERRTAARGGRLRLDDPRRCYRVLRGRLELFARVDLDGDLRRIHLATLGAGDLAFGVFGTGDGVALEALVDGAEVETLDSERLLAPAGRGAAAAAIERWVRVSGGAVAPAVPPREVRTVAAGARAALPEEAAVAAASGLVWARVEDGALWPFGVRPAEAGVAVPLSTALWAELHEGGEVSGYATGAAELDLPRALAAHHGMVTALLAQRVVRERDADVRRIRRRRVVDDEALARASERLAAVARGPAGKAPAASGEPPLLAAARLVGEAGGIAMRAPAGGAGTLEAAEDPLEAIADAAGCEFRTVSLEGAWWRDDGGPLLVFRDADLAPLALLPGAGGRAELVDPATGIRSRLDRRSAATLFGVAVMFYPAPDAGGLGGLLRLGARGVGRDLGVALTMLLLVGAASLVAPMVVGAITGSVVEEARVEQLGVLIGALVVAAFASVGFTYVQSLAALRMEGRVDVRAQAALWIRLLRLPAAFFRDYTVGDLTARALGIDAMRRLLTGSVLAGLLSVATGVFSLGLMFYYDVVLAAAALLLLTLYAGVMAYFIRRSLHRQALLLAQQSRVQALTLQLLQAVAKLRVGGAEARAFGRWADQYAHARTLDLAWKRTGSVVPIGTALLNFAGLTLFVALVAMQAGQFWGPELDAFSWHAIDAATLQRVISAPEFLAFFTAYGQLFIAVTAVVQVSTTLLGVVPLRERMRPLLEAAVETRAEGESPGELGGAVEVADVAFRYRPDMPLVLRGLGLSIEAGSFVALVGPSGAGKSSLVRLLLGFEEPEAGAVFYDGKDLARLDKRAVRRQLGVVLQNGRLMSGSIYDNIVAGSNLSEEAAWEAARMAGLDRDIEAMPMKMQTVVAEGATTLSGGQRQRLMIARAIVRRPRVLIFDEATSALDNETQKIVGDSLARLNCTRIAIAHRLSTIVGADRIFVIDAGRVVESGRYEELMARDGVFAQLARRQIA